MKFKRITSLCLTWSFIVLMVSSIVLYVLPSGRIAHWANWEFLGLGKEQWGALHTNNGYLFLLACALHIYFNFSHILNYMKNRKRELSGMNINSIIAFLLVLLIAIFTLVGIPPISWIQELNGHFKSQAEVKFGTPPYGHAELSSVRDFARRTGMVADEVVEKLKAAGFEGVEAEVTLEHIADQNNVSPQTLVNTLWTHGNKSEGKGSGNSVSDGCSEEGTDSASSHEKETSFNGSGGGYGQKVFEEVCHDLGVDPAIALNEIESLGYEAKLKETLKTIASRKGEKPSEIMQVLRELAKNR